MEKERIDQFLRDAADFCGSLRRALKRLEQEPTNRDLVHQSFRFVHSLKSEAQLVGIDDIGAVAHEMEGVLDQIRRGTLAVDGQSLGILFPMVGVLDEMLGSLSPHEGEPEGNASALSGERNGVSNRGHGARPGTVLPGGSSLPHFGDFERQLIYEARGRGETLYRMTCRIEDTAPLKYPKAYLVVNNLEVKTNVILTIPSFDTTDDEMFQTFDVYYTASLPEAEIRESVDVDQISSVEIGEITFEQLAAAGEVAPDADVPAATRRSSSTVRIENGRLDEIALRLHSVAKSVDHLNGSRRSTGDGEGLAAAIDELSADIDSLASLISDVRKVRFAEELRQIPWLVQDIAAKLGKRVRLSFWGGSVVVDRRLISVLSEAIVHLVRNAVDHGIETPEERSALGKQAEGVVVISAVQRGDELLLQVGDDGRGISESAVLSRTSELGFEASDDRFPITIGGGERDEAAPLRSGRLLRLLIRPGFSTRTEPTAVSGRGVGLDAIYQKVHQSLGGELRLQTQEGKGTLFTIAIPAASTMISVLIVRCGSSTVAVPLRDVDGIVEASRSAFEETQDGTVSFEGRPVRRLTAQAESAELPGDKATVIRLRGAGTPRVLLCDEILSERDILEGRLALSEPDQNGLRDVAIAGTPAEFFLLDAAAIE